MSRSYKKHSYCTDHHLHNTMKRYANKKVRKTKGSFHGNEYKKLFCSYDICDYKFRETEQMAIEWWELHEVEGWYSTFEDFMKHWAKYYYRK